MTSVFAEQYSYVLLCNEVIKQKLTWEFAFFKFPDLELMSSPIFPVAVKSALKGKWNFLYKITKN